MKTSSRSFSKIASMVALAFFVFGAAHSQGEEKVDSDERIEQFESKKYKRMCKRFNKSGKVAQTERAEAGLEPRILCRVPPRYPDACQQKANSLETVVLIYDVTPEGFVANIRLVEATNECFALSAAKSVYLYRYQATEKGGSGIEATVTFKLAW